MGIKRWLARHTSNPLHYGEAFASGALELICHLASSIVAFSGKRPAGDGPVAQPFFEKHFEMESAGFDPITEDVASLVLPPAKEMAAHELFRPAYTRSTAFVCFYSDNAARKHMRPGNAQRFSLGLNSSVARRCAGQYGLDPEPRVVFKLVQGLFPSLVCGKMLNQESFGIDDGMGAILNTLSSPDGKFCYGFVVGSRRQPIGLASNLVRVISDIDERIARCAVDLRW